MSVSLTRAGFEAYKTYIALKQHFSRDSGYDFFRYKGRIGVAATAFEARRDAYMFVKLAKQPKWKRRLLANISRDPGIWIGDILSDDGEKRYVEWERRQQSLTRIFERDLCKLKEPFEENFAVKNGGWPHVAMLYQRGEISPETLCILATQTDSITYWDKNVNDKMLFGDINTFVKNYTPFIKGDPEKFASIIRDKSQKIT